MIQGGLEPIWHFEVMSSFYISQKFPTEPLNSGEIARMVKMNDHDIKL